MSSAPRPKKQDDSAATVERFERALRRALNTPPESPRKKPARGKKKRDRA